MAYEQEELLDHYKYPRNRKTIAVPDFSSDMLNPSCGDSICMQGTVNNNILVDVGFTGSGCVISQASASLLTEWCKQKALDQILALTGTDMVKLVGINLGPVRSKCALLSLEALQAGIRKVCEKQKKSTYRS